MVEKNKSPSKEIQKRISKRGAITDADIQQYIDEVGIANLGNMSMNDVEQFLKNYIELGQRKKKLPSKKKIEPTDSLVVADQGGELVKVPVEDQKKAEEAEAPAQDVDPANPDKFKNYAKAAGLGVLGLGSLAFNKMFPTLGRLMAAFDKRIRKQDNHLGTVNANNQENARQVSRSSVFLSRIAENQLRTNELLEQIIAAASGATLVPQSNTNINFTGGPDIDLRRRPPGASGTSGATPDGRTPAQQGSAGAPAQRTTPAPAASPRGAGVAIATMLGLTAVGVAAGTAAYAATRPTAPTPTAGTTGGAAARSNATPEATETAIPSLPTPPAMTAEAVRRAAAPITEQEQAQLFANRVLNVRAKDIIFKADRFEFDQEPTAAGTAAAPPPFVTSRAGGGATAAAGAAAAAASGQIQTIIERITQEFPNVIVTSTLRPNDTNSEHATGNAADLSLRGLTQEQRATLIQNITTGRYGNVGGMGTYNATGDLLHIDTRSGARMAWGPNRSRTSLDQTPQWFQAAVTPWMSGATATAQREQEPAPGGEQMATPAPSRPSTGAQVAQASVRSEVSTMQSQQVSSTLGEAPEQPAAPTGSVEASATMIDPNEPGSVEPPDAAQRYAKLFNLAA